MGRRMRDEEDAHALLQLGFPDDRLKPIGQIDNFFEGSGFDAKHFGHMHKPLLAEMFYHRKVGWSRQECTTI